ncbi:MAG: alpha-amylase family glycosyl hydrolase [Planctomycetota bacterium]
MTRLGASFVLAMLALCCAPPAAHSQQVSPAGQVGPARSFATGFQYIGIFVGGYVSQLELALIDIGQSGGDLYIRRGQKPTLKHYDARSVTPGTTNETIVLGPEGDTGIETGAWWIGIHGPPDLEFEVQTTNVPIASDVPGLGSIPYPATRTEPAGVAFRVWAPFADQVHLAGDFNGYSEFSAPMASEGNGYWSLNVRDAGVGTQYEYVVRNDGQVLKRPDPRAKQLTNSVGNSIVFDAGQFEWSDVPYGTPFWNDLVLYEMHIGTFNDAPGGPVGTFDTAIERLDQIAELGVNALLVMPVNEFGGDYSWGYNPAHIFSVESAYGGPQAFQRFVDAAHQRGLAVLLDVVHNHWGPSDLGVWQFDGWFESSDGKDWGGIYFYNSPLAVTQWGDTRPDYGRPEVRQFIRDSVMYFIEEFRLDGFRFDSTSNIDVDQGWSLMQWINDEIDATQPWKINIAEDLQNNAFITKATAEGGAGFDSQWDAQFVHPIRGTLITPNDDDRSMWVVRDALAANYNGQPYQRVIYTESHDEVANGSARVPEEIWPGNAASWYSKKRSTLGGALVLTAPGIPMLFQGQELLEDEFFQDTDPLDWNKASTFAGIRQLYGDLIKLRRDWYDNTAGLKGPNLNVHHVNDGDKVVAFHRWDQGGPGDDVVVLANFRDRSWGSYRIGVPRDGLWRVRFNSDWSGYDPAFGNHPADDVTADSIPWDGMPYSIDLSFGPYTCVILSQ